MVRRNGPVPFISRFAVGAKIPKKSSRKSLYPALVVLKSGLFSVFTRKQAAFLFGISKVGPLLWGVGSAILFSGSVFPAHLKLF